MEQNIINHEGNNYSLKQWRDGLTALSTYYKLDKNNNRIPSMSEKRQCLNIDGSKSYELVFIRNCNVTN